ncbi:hypothetical protein [Algivirga pacifica]|uniref:Uncharacterized protein n=1 Tax=Algivirga pacifica TaxID=1162670 RepID=A0ABP9D0P4_9BACT
MVQHFDLHDIIMTYRALSDDRKEKYLNKIMKQLSKASEEVQEELIPELERYIEEEEEKSQLYGDNFNQWYA